MRDDFNVYRCRIEYPVLPSSAVMQFDPAAQECWDVKIHTESTV